MKKFENWFKKFGKQKRLPAFRNVNTDFYIHMADVKKNGIYHMNHMVYQFNTRLSNIY